MPNMDYFTATHADWSAQPAPRFCYHENSIVRVRDDRSKVGCTSCGLVGDVEMGALEAIMQP